MLEAVESSSDLAICKIRVEGVSHAADFRIGRTVRKGIHISLPFEREQKRLSAAPSSGALKCDSVDMGTGLPIYHQIRLSLKIKMPFLMFEASHMVFCHHAP